MVWNVGSGLYSYSNPPTHTPCSGELEVNVDQNRTWVQLSPLDPGSAYLVAVAGVNSNGAGKFSEYQTVMTLSPEGQCRRNGNMKFFLSTQHKFCDTGRLVSFNLDQCVYRDSVGVITLGACFCGVAVTVVAICFL